MSSVICPGCNHEWHNAQCTVFNCECKSFAQILEEQLEKQKQDEEIRKEQPHKNFLVAAIEAGFSDVQAEFMWKWFAMKYHEHWDGHIG